MSWNGASSPTMRFPSSGRSDCNEDRGRESLASTRPPLDTNSVAKDVRPPDACAGVRPATPFVPGSRASATSSPAPESALLSRGSGVRAQPTAQAVAKRVKGRQGTPPQLRGPCPLHGQQQDRRRCFSVHLTKQVFRCFHPDCAAQGNVLDLWATARHLPLYEAALDLANTFPLDPYGNRTRRHHAASCRRFYRVSTIHRSPNPLTASSGLRMESRIGWRRRG